ncbi:MAG TPA: hypothetical protein VFB38_16055 [Chthonomonadaceae bacterium]|nr:hypothetical protein [Chthonomonadaceae bacterium]
MRIPTNKRASRMHIGVGFYRREEEWEWLKAISIDREALHASYDEWQRDFEARLSDLQRQGVKAKKVEVEVMELLAWCEQQARPVCAETRAQFVAVKLQEEDVAK